MRKKWIALSGLLLTLLPAALIGCKNTGDEMSPVEKSGKEENGENAAAEGAQPEHGLPGEGSGIILEDEGAVYICSFCQIRKLNKDSGEVTILWEREWGDEKGGVSIYNYSDGIGLLVNNKIYFVEKWLENDEAACEMKEALSVVNTDGTDYQRLEEQENFVSTMYYADNALYVYYYSDMRVYELAQDGGLSYSQPLTDSSPYGIPEGYALAGVTPFESMEAYGYMLLKDESDRLIKTEPETGEKTPVSEDLLLLNQNKDYFLCRRFGDGGNRELYLLDARTLEKELFMELEEGEIDTAVLAMDEDYIYTCRDNGGDGSSRLYERIALSDGSRQELFTVDKIYVPGYFIPDSMMYFVIHNGYMYYVGAGDYKMYPMRRSLEEPGREETLGEPFYDSGVSKVGTMDSYYEEIMSQVSPDIVLTKIDLWWLEVDEGYPGAGEINRILKEEQDAVIAYGRESDVEWREEEIRNSGDDYPSYLSYSYSSNPSEITYFDGDYFSFYQQGYEYTGGAHGMPYWVGYTFDLNAGKRLLLSDLIENSREELKDIVTEYFDGMISRNPDSYWEGALESVREWIDFDSDFYLTEEGINFYFGPYALASYADGFQEVTIPFEEFQLRIPVGTEKMREAEAAGAGNSADAGDDADMGSGKPADMTTADHDVNGRELPIYCVDTSEKKIALTFDAAWGNEDTDQILDILKKHNVHVTFFMTGGWVESYPEDVKAVLAAGHDLGNHSENHKNMSQLSDEEKRDEVMKVHNKVKELTGYDMFLFRPPYGDYDNAVVDTVKGCGYYPIQWDVDSLDWENKGVDNILKTVTGHKNLGNGSIILCHNGAEFTAQALDELITALEDMGYSLTPLSELIYREDYHLNFEGRQIKN